MARLFSEDRSGGPVPKFTDYHVWKSIMTIGERGPIGRKALSAALDIGEGSVRTILEKLQEKGFVDVSRSGAVLTRKGKEVMRSSVIDVERVDGGFLTIDQEDCAVRVRNASHRVLTYGCVERDVAIRAGATGATTLLMKDGHLYFPGDEEPIEPGVEERLNKAFDLQDGDVILLGTGSTYELAEKGAVTAALRLSGEVRRRKDFGDLLRGPAKREDLKAMAMMLHRLCENPVCARITDEPGLRLENGAVEDDSFTGPLLEKSLKKRAVLEEVSTHGPYMGRTCRVVPLEVDGRVLAAFGIVLDDEGD